MLIWLAEHAAIKCYKNSTLKNKKSKFLRFGPTLTCYISRLERHPALKFWLLFYLYVSFQKVQKIGGSFLKWGMLRAKQSRWAPGMALNRLMAKRSG